MPAPVLYLVAAALVADVVTPLEVHTAELIGVVALVVILFDGGMEIGRERMRAAAAPVLVVAIAGTFLTAAIVATAAHVLLGLDWTLAGLVGAALAPTDPAVVFSVLRGQRLKGRVGTILEGEAGFNDPAGIALMLGLLELATHPDESFGVVAEVFVVQMGLGTVFGVAGALVIRRAPHALLGLALAGGLYAVTALCGGSGFLAVFIAGILSGGAGHPRLAGAAEVTVFAALGLTIPLTHVAGGTWVDGVVLFAVLALVARPLTIALTLPRERGSVFLAWCGLKGAVPILLAAFAVAEGFDAVYELVFVVVLLSVLVQGTPVPRIARRLQLL